ncbi:MAG: hypothetical protein IKX79_02300 [Desulfovibrionaceae bacterium]|nr:hypothetical protein [Desulfovibrionaceae bacterium]MBR5734359.1 hypothetical protein [Desulfovibrionaceae bacterium]
MKQSSGPHPGIAEKNGVYQWQYDLSLFKDLSIFWLILKIFFFISMGIGLFMFVLTLFEGLPSRDELPFLLLFPLGLFGLMAALLVLGYLVYALIMGGHYSMAFAMDGQKITHSQLASQFKRYQKAASALTVLAALSKNPTAAGIGLSTGSRQSMTSHFKDVKAIEAEPKKDLIHLTAGASHNRIYVPAESYAFVLEYVREHCAKAAFSQR